MRLQNRHRYRLAGIPPRAVGLYVFVCLVFACIGCVPTKNDVRSVRHAVPIGSDTVDVVVHTSDEPGLTFVNLHDDENTAVSAAMDVLASHGGRLIELQHSGDRTIRFRIGGSVYSVDPNRIFTPRGIDSTLAFHGATSDSARGVVEHFSRRLVDVIGPDTLGMVVAVHNNTPDNYSVRSYTAEGRFEQDARFVHVAADADADDFFFVTTERLYRDLRDAGYNVVMQHNAFATDDGSLSVWCGQRGIPYVNAEAEHGHFEAQQKMLAHLHELLATSERLQEVRP